ncbi:hypothetical protein EV401DRAFT_2030832 [Pisolithus croceorrhizus]|nr:hypothetical protein EV401DRAFT_2030832 [Pisolithus croceorrhizus]
MLFTGDTMSVIKHYTLLDTLNLHWTRVTQMIYGARQLWTTSSDETIQIMMYPPDPSVLKLVPPLIHLLPVCANLMYVVTTYGDIIWLYNISTMFKLEVVGEIDAHWHDTSCDVAGRIKIEPFIISVSLDRTV